MIYSFDLSDSTFNYYHLHQQQQSDQKHECMRQTNAKIGLICGVLDDLANEEQMVHQPLVWSKH